jgi:hypothetical protein
MIAELDAIAEAGPSTSSGNLAQPRYYIVDVLFHGEPLISLKFLLAVYGLAIKSSA